MGSGVEDLAKLLGAPLLLATATGALDFLLSERQGARVREQAKAWVKRRMLSTPFIVTLYAVTLPPALTVSSVNIAAGLQQQTVTLDQGGDSRELKYEGTQLRELVWVHPFGSTVELRVEGYVPLRTTLYPVTGLRLRVERDLTTGTTLLLRPVGDALQLLAGGSPLRVLRAAPGRQCHELVAQGTGAGSKRLGSPRDLPDGYLRLWDLELRGKSHVESCVLLSTAARSSTTGFSKAARRVRCPRALRFSTTVGRSSVSRTGQRRSPTTSIRRQSKCTALALPSTPGTAKVPLKSALTAWTSDMDTRIWMYIVASLLLAGFARADVAGDLDRARAEAKAGDWVQAERAVVSARASCADGDAGRRCRALAGFNTAWIASERARAATGDARARHLSESVDAYEQVLTEHPQHAATATNLALVHARQRDVAAITNLRERFAEAEPATQRTLARTHADALLSAGHTLDGVVELRGLLELGADPDTLLKKMADAFAGAPDAAIVEPLFDSVARWGGEAPDAREYLLRVLCLHAGDMPRSIWNRALTDWGLAAADLVLVTAADVEELFGRTSERAINDLGRILQAPPELFPEGELWRYLDVLDEWGDYAWWTAGPDRRHALSAIALARGHLELVAGEPEQALHWWTWGLAVSPNVYVYGNGEALGEEQAVPLELLSELVALVDRHRATLDPDGVRFDRFVNLLFQGKTSAYAFADLRSIQRHHTILGRIFADQGRWEESGPMGARFQLEHALRAAERRAEVSGASIPLPDLKATLADGLIGLAQVRNRGAERLREEAAGLYAEAAIYYLDLDDLQNADGLLERAVSATGASDRLDALVEVAELRRRLPADVEVAATSDWTATLDEDFVLRQQFKLLADVAAERGGEDDARRALTVAADLGYLTSYADAARMQTLAEQLADIGHFDVEVAAGDPVIDEDGLLWQLPTVDGDSTYVAAKGVGIKAAFPAVGVYFDSGAVAVEVEQVRAVQALVEQAEDDPEAHFTLTSQTDRVGSADRNQALAQDRGESVKALLIEAGVAEERITIRALGESGATAVPQKPDFERRVHVRVDRAGRLSQ